MTELKPSTMIRYFTGENGKHYSAVVLKDNKILSLKKAGEKDKTIYDSLLHWIATLPEGVGAADLDITEKDTIPRAPTALKKDTIALKDIAPNYDLLRFLLTYEANTFPNSLVSKENVYLRRTRTYVKDAKGDLHAVKYNRAKKLLYSEFHDKFGSTLEEIGFPSDTDIYVSVPAWHYNKRYRDWSVKKMSFPFTIDNYESFYNAKTAFIYPDYVCMWPDYKKDTNHHYNLLCKFFEDQGYYIWNDNFRYYNSDSIFVNKQFKYMEANMVTVQANFTELIVFNYNPLGFVKIQFKESDDVILEEIKTILG
jgi:hypothetical protein